MVKDVKIWPKFPSPICRFPQLKATAKTNRGQLRFFCSKKYLLLYPFPSGKKWHSFSAVCPQFRQISFTHRETVTIRQDRSISRARQWNNNKNRRMVLPKKDQRELRSLVTCWSSSLAQQAEERGLVSWLWPTNKQRQLCSLTQVIVSDHSISKASRIPRVLRSALLTWVRINKVFF